METPVRKPESARNSRTHCNLLRWPARNPARHGAGTRDDRAVSGGVRGLVMNLLSSGEALADAMARRGGDRLWNLDASAADVC